MPSSLQHEKKRSTREGSPVARGGAAEKSLMERANLQGWESLPVPSQPQQEHSARRAEPDRQAVPSLAHPQVSKAQSPSPREPRQSGLGDWALHWHLLSWKPHTRATMQTPHRGPCSCENRGFTLCRFHLCELTLTHQTLKKNGTAAH